MKHIFFLIIFLITGFGIYQVNSQNLDEISSELQLIKEMKFDFNVPNSNIVYNKTLQSLDKDILLSKDYGSPPNLNWAGQFGGSANDNTCDIVTDGTGNIYISGSFSGEISVGSETYKSVGLVDGIIIKVNNSGSLLWAKQLSPTRGESLKTFALCVDGSGNIYVTGYYTGDVILGGYSLPSDAYYNLFFTKLNSSGDILMASYHINNGDNEVGYKIDADDSGNIYIIGLQTDSPEVDNAADLIYNHSIVSNSVLFKCDPVGDLIWEHVYPLCFAGIEVSENSIYYTGINSGSDGYLDENITLGYPQNMCDVFYTKSNLDGDFIWGEMVSHDNSSGYEGYSWFPSLSIDSEENIYLAGYYSDDIILSEDTITSYTSSAKTSFVAKCDSAGELMWVDNIENENYADDNVIYADINGNCYISHGNSLVMYNTLGIEQWTKALKYTPNSFTVNSSDKILQCGDLEGLMFISQSDNNINEEWFIRVNGNSGNGHVIGMLTDNAGNLYTYGSVSNTTEYFGREINEKLFVSKQNNSGDLLWLKEFPYDGGISADIGTQLYIDTIRSYLYITGELDFNLIIPGETTLTPAGSGSIFIVKFDLNGNYVWSVQEDFDGDELSITVDYAGNVILTGVFSGTITIGGTELISEGYDDTFVAKYDADGNFLWAFGAGGEWIEYNLISSTDTMNNIYITGEFISENITIDETEITLLEGDGNIVFAKIDPDGNVEWVKSYANSNHSWHDGLCWPTGIITDINGSSYIKGWHGDSTYFGDIMLTSIGYYFNKFITKIDNNGDVLWAKSIKETYHGFDYNQFDIDSEGSVYFGAQVVDTIYFGEDYMYIPKGDDLFVAKYTTNGDLEWVKTMEGIDNAYNWISSVAVDKYHNVFVGGYFSDSLSLDNQLLTSPNRHGFVVKFGNEIILPTANLICADASICEGDTTDISIELTGASPWNITYTDGTTPSSVTSNDNIYSFKVSSGGTYEVIALSDANYTGIYFGSSVVVSVEPTPIADYTYEKNDLTVTFTNTSENADTYIWDFGDDITSTAINPVRTYLNYGSYQVELSAISNNCGSNIESKTINVSITSVDNIDSEEYVKVIPNPSDGIITLEIRNSITGDVMIELIRSDGLVVYKKEFNKSGGVLKETIDLSNNPDGVYILRIISNNIIRNKKVLINR